MEKVLAPPLSHRCLYICIYLNGPSGATRWRSCKTKRVHLFRYCFVFLLIILATFAAIPVHLSIKKKTYMKEQRWRCSSFVSRCFGVVSVGRLFYDIFLFFSFTFSLVQSEIKERKSPPPRYFWPHPPRPLLFRSLFSILFYLSMMITFFLTWLTFPFRFFSCFSSSLLAIFSVCCWAANEMDYVTYIHILWWWYDLRINWFLWKRWIFE